MAGRERTLGCVITIGAGLDEPGHAIRTDSSPIGFKIGELDGPDTERARRLVAVVDAVAGARLTTNLVGERWSKLAVNCMANPLAGLSGYGSGEVFVQPLSRRLAIRIAAEVIQVGRAAGHTIEPIAGLAAQRFVDAAAGQGQAALEAELLALGQGRTAGRPSFLQDVLRGRRTEINELNGLVVAEGQRLGVPTPVNQAVVREVLRHGVGTLQPSPRNLEPLASLVSSTTLAERVGRLMARTRSRERRGTKWTPNMEPASSSPALTAAVLEAVDTQLRAGDLRETWQTHDWPRCRRGARDRSMAVWHHRTQRVDHRPPAPADVRSHAS